MGNSGCFLRGKPAAIESRYPAHGACWVVQCFHNPQDSDMDNRSFKVHTDVNVYDYTRRCTGTVKESALKVDSGRKNPSRTGESNLPQRCAGPTFYQLSYIPTHFLDVGLITEDLAASPYSSCVTHSATQYNGLLFFTSCVRTFVYVTIIIRLVRWSGFFLLVSDHQL